MSEQNTPTSNTHETAQADSFGFCDWGTLPEKGKRKGDGERNDKFVNRLFLKETEKGKPYRLRILGRMFKIYRHYNPIRAISPGEKQDVCWQAGNIPKDRYTILAMDRNDNNRFVLLEAGISVFREFENYHELSGGKNPGGEEAPDWVIKVVVPEKKGKDGKYFKDKRSTEYKVMHDQVTSLTEEERARIKELLKNWNIQKANAPAAPELIAEMFEQAKVRKDGEPVPGSGAWWRARRDAEKDDSGDSGSTTPRESFNEETPAGDSDSSEGFDNMFDDSSGNENTAY